MRARFSRRLALGAALAAAGASRAAAASPVWALAPHPSRPLLAAGLYRQVCLIDLAANSIQRLAGASGQVRCLAWSGDGTVLAAGGGEPGISGEVRLWKLPGGEPLAAHRLHRDQVEGVALLGDRLLTAGLDERACISKTADGALLRALTDHTARLTDIAASPDGRFIATASLDGTVKLWDAGTLEGLANLDRNNGPVHRLLFPRPDLLLAGCDDGAARSYALRETRAGNQRGVNGVPSGAIAGRREPVLAMAMAPGGKSAAVADAGEVRLLNAALNGVQRRIGNLPAPVWSLALAADGTEVMTGGRDGVVRFYGVKEGKPGREISLSE